MGEKGKTLYAKLSKITAENKSSKKIGRIYIFYEGEHSEKNLLDWIVLRSIDPNKIVQICSHCNEYANLVQFITRYLDENGMTMDLEMDKFYYLFDWDRHSAANVCHTPSADRRKNNELISAFFTDFCTEFAIKNNAKENVKNIKLIISQPAIEFVFLMGITPSFDRVSNIKTREEAIDMINKICRTNFGKENKNFTRIFRENKFNISNYLLNEEKILEKNTDLPLPDDLIMYFHKESTVFQLAKLVVAQSCSYYSLLFDELIERKIIEI